MEDEVRLDNQLCFQINRAHQLFNRFYQEPLGKFDLTYVQYTVLLALWQQDEVTVNELGNQVGLGTGTLTPLLKRMENSGWLTRTRSKEDERRVIIQLTDKAKQQHSAILDETKSCIERLNFNDRTYEDVMGAVHDIQKRLEQVEQAHQTEV